MPPMKRTNYNGPKAKRANKAQTGKMTAQQYEQLQKNSGEKKGLDTALFLNPVIATVNTNASSFTLNLVRPGTASYNRVGRKIFNKSVRIVGQLEFSYQIEGTTNDMTGNVCRMVVVWDKQPSGAVPSFDDIFGITTQDGTEASAFSVPPKYDNMNRFQVLRDKCFHDKVEAITATGGTTNEIVTIVPFDEYIKLGNRTTVYSGQSSPCTIADISSGALYVFFRAYENNGANDISVSGNTYARLRYSD